MGVREGFPPPPNVRPAPSFLVLYRIEAPPAHIDVNNVSHPEILMDFRLRL